MIFYKAGRQIRGIEELETGQLYSVCGAVGVLSLEPVPETGENVYKFVSNGEKLCLLIGREELMDRVHLGMVYVIKGEIKPRKSTMAKLYSNIKK